MKDLNSFGNFSNDWIFGEFPKNLGILEIFQLPMHLGNSSNSYKYLRVVYFKDFGNFSNDWKFPRYPGI